MSSLLAFFNFVLVLSLTSFNLFLMSHTNDDFHMVDINYNTFMDDNIKIDPDYDTFGVTSGTFASTSLLKQCNIVTETATLTVGFEEDFDCQTLWNVFDEAKSEQPQKDIDMTNVEPLKDTDKCSSQSSHFPSLNEKTTQTRVPNEESSKLPDFFDDTIFTPFKLNLLLKQEKFQFLILPVSKTVQEQVYIFTFSFFYAHRTLELVFYQSYFLSNFVNLVFFC